MAINVISDVPYIVRSIRRDTAPNAAESAPRPSVSHAHPVVTTELTAEVTTENWDIVHWKKFRYEIVDSLTPFPDALAAFLGVVESFRARAVNGKIPVDPNGGPP